MIVVPCTLREASAFVAEHHRHHRPPAGGLFALAVADERVRGVAIVGRPVARMLDDGATAEVTRLCTDGARNACSMLYGAAWRAARALGWRRLVTYTLPTEGGGQPACQRLAAGGRGGWWVVVAFGPTARRSPPHPGEAPLGGVGVTALEVGAGAILVGDARARLLDVPEASCRAAITSPPYWGLRLYGGGEAELGREPNVDEYVAALLETMRLVRRALTTDGTLWLNLGDCFARSGGRGGGYGRSSQAHPLNRMANSARRSYPERASWGGTPDKGLVGLPWRVGLMLQADGWIWRAVVPWLKRNSMPENVADRPAVSVEYVLMFARSERTYYNADAIRRPYSSQPTSAARTRGRGGRGDGYSTPGRVEHHPLGRLARTGDLFFDSVQWALDDSFEGLVVGHAGEPLALVTSLHPTDFGHVATYPEQLVEPLVRVSSEPGDTILDPFLGSGTTAVVAQRLGRRWWGCELTPSYAETAAARIRAKAAQIPLSLGATA